MRAIDAPEPYGKRMIEDITDIVAADYHNEVKKHGLEDIKEYQRLLTSNSTTGPRLS
jgi:hypothetical protein